MEKQLYDALKLLRGLVKEDPGGAPRYTVTPGAALNTVVTDVDRVLKEYERNHGIKDRSD